MAIIFPYHSYSFLPKMYSLSSPPRTSEVWDSIEAERINIQRSISTSNWSRLFLKLTINERLELLFNMLMNTFRNDIPNKKVKFRYGEALWINKYIKYASHKRSRLTKRHYVNGHM